MSVPIQAKVRVCVQCDQEFEQPEDSVLKCVCPSCILPIEEPPKAPKGMIRLRAGENTQVIDRDWLRQ